MSGLFTKGMRSEYDDEVLPSEQQAQSKQEVVVAWVNDHKREITKAWTPERFEQFRNSLAELVTIDEVKAATDNWTMMLAYGKQINAGPEMMRELKRVLGRAFQELGRRLELEKAAPGANLPTKPPSGGLSSAVAVGKELGLKRKQVDKALAIAAVPQDVFDADQSSDKPSSPTALANKGRAARAEKKPPQKYDPSDIRSDERKAVVTLNRAITYFLTESSKANLKHVNAGLTPKERKQVIKDCTAIAERCLKIAERMEVDVTPAKPKATRKAKPKAKPRRKARR